MNKTKRLLFVWVLTFVQCLGFGSNTFAHEQPPANESKQLEYSLDIFSRKIVSKNKVINLQYKRYGRQAVLSFDMIKPNEMLYMLYLLEYDNGDWRISKEYHYSKTIVAPSTASVC